MSKKNYRIDFAANTVTVTKKSCVTVCSNKSDSNCYPTCILLNLLLSLFSVFTWNQQGAWRPDSNAPRMSLSGRQASWDEALVTQAQTNHFASLSW